MSNRLNIKTSLDVIGTTFPDALDRSGLTAEYLSERMREAIDAKDGDGLPMWAIRLKAIDQVHRCKGNYQDKLTVEPVRQMEDKLEASIIEKIGQGNK